MRVFLPKYFAFSFICGILLFCWNQFTPPEIHGTVSWYIFGFFMLSTLLIHSFFLKSEKQGPQVFVRQFLTITTLKLFVYLIALIIVFLCDREEARLIAAYFLAMYFAFTVFEVGSLYKKLRK